MSRSLPRPHALLVLAVLLAVVPAARAGILRVPREFATIQAAVDAAQPGDVVVIGKGRYAETVVVDGKTDLELRGRGAVLQGTPFLQEAVLTVRNSTGTVLRSLRFEDYAEAGVELRNCQQTLLLRCRFLRGERDGVNARLCTDLTVRRCRFDDNGDDALRMDDITGLLLSGLRIRGADDEGIEVNGSTAVTVERCRVLDVGGDGLQFSTEESPGIMTDGLRVTRTRVVRPGEDGIDLRGDDAVVERCNVRDPREHGLSVEGGARAQVLRNRVRRSLGDGLLLGAVTQGALLERNRIKQAGGDGIELAGAGHGLSNNRIARPAGDGVRVLSGGHELVGNRVSRAGAVGVHLEAGGNTVTDNAARGSAQFDLQDMAGGNVYADNTFGTENVVP